MIVESEVIHGRCAMTGAFTATSLVPQKVMTDGICLSRAVCAFALAFAFSSVLLSLSGPKKSVHPN